MSIATFALPSGHRVVTDSTGPAPGGAGIGRPSRRRPARAQFADARRGTNSSFPIT